MERYRKGLIDKKEFYKKRRALHFSVVGTPDYIALEVFGQGGYVETVDWWSVGVILFEMLVGYPPFFAEEPSITCQKILNWRKTLVIPPEANLSPAATDILKKMICDHDHRLGRAGAEEIKTHAFFEGVDWANIRGTKAPFVTKLTSEVDTVNFDPFEEEEPFYPPPAKRQLNSKKVRRPPPSPPHLTQEALNYFHNFTYNREAEEDFNKIWSDSELRRLLVLALEESKEEEAAVVKEEAPPHPRPVVGMRGHAFMLPQWGERSAGLHSL